MKKSSSPGNKITSKVSSKKPPQTTAGPTPSPPPRLKHVDAFEIFELSIARAQNLLKMHNEAHGRRAKPPKHLADAHRAAIVLSISALDAFVRTFVVARIRAILATKSLAVPDGLRDKIKSFLKEDGLFDAARSADLLTRVEKAFQADFERKSFQGTANIQTMMKIVGYENIFHEVAVGANINEKTLRADLDRFTRRRHTIAHRGDYDLDRSPPVENVVTKKDAQECIRIMKCIAVEINKIGQSK